MASQDPRGELIKGARPNVGELRSKRGKKSDIPTPSKAERDKVLARLKGKKKSK